MITETETNAQQNWNLQAFSIKTYPQASHPQKGWRKRNGNQETNDVKCNDSQETNLSRGDRKAST